MLKENFCASIPSLAAASSDYRKRMATVDNSSIIKLPENIALDLLPTGVEWITHIKEDLLPFWITPEALGSPTGNFPTFRANSGAVIDPKNPPPEITKMGTHDTWLANRIGRQYTDMNSRQIFAYCVAYHLTGVEKYLEYAKAGIDYMFTKMVDQHGHFYTWIENGKGAPENIKQRTSQQMAYALMGPALYYYLTRDPEVLKVLLKTQQYIFSHYKEGNYLRWVNQDFTDLEEVNLTTQKELVAQLDQINAYMLIATTVLEPKYRKIWLDDMLLLAHTMKDEFFNAENNIFWGRIDDESYKKLNQPHVGFGHAIKTLWMMYIIGNRFKIQDLSHFALKHMPQIFREAYSEELHTWIEKKFADGFMGTDRVWWIHDELDQAAATLSLINLTDIRHLVSAYRYWFFDFVDLKNKEVWHTLTGKHERPRYLKAHLWKNAFHDFEHALVGYIACQAIRKQPVKLY